MRKVSGRNAKYSAAAIAAKTNNPANRMKKAWLRCCSRRRRALPDISIGSGADIGSENRVAKVLFRHVLSYAVSRARGTLIAAAAKLNTAKTWLRKCD